MLANQRSVPITIRIISFNECVKTQSFGLGLNLRRPPVTLPPSALRPVSFAPRTLPTMFLGSMIVLATCAALAFHYWNEAVLAGDRRRINKLQLVGGNIGVRHGREFIRTFHIMSTAAATRKFPV